MSLELNAIPSVETLNFYKELAEQEPFKKNIMDIIMRKDYLNYQKWKPIMFMN